MQQPFCLMDGSVCSCYMHYTGFPSALCSPAFLPLVIYIWDLLPWVHFPLHACTEDWNLLKKIAQHHFNPFRAEQKAYTLGKAMGFPACRDLAEPRAKPIYSASLAVVCITFPERNLAKWDLNTTEYFLLWRHVAKSCTFHYHDWKWCTKGTWKSQL